MRPEVSGFRLDSTDRSLSQQWSSERRSRSGLVVAAAVLKIAGGE
jgi:hypothetical protein